MSDYKDDMMHNDYRQALNAMQMWRASSDTMSYGEMKSGEEIVAD